MALRHRALDEEGEDYESFMLHFREDTMIDPPTPSHSSASALAGKPWVVGWTAKTGHAGFWLYQSLPWSAVPAWSGSGSGGALYVYLFERFDQIELCLTAGGVGGTLRVEYPSAVSKSTAAADGVNVDRLATTWSTITPLSDGTRGLQQSGTVRWAPPADWEVRSRSRVTMMAVYRGHCYVRSTSMIHLKCLLTVDV